jgi:small subunit ribosomal protein S18
MEDKETTPEQPAAQAPSGDRGPYRPSGDRPSGDRGGYRSGPRRDSGDGGGGKRRFFRKKVCYFCQKKIAEIDYKNIDMLRRFITEHGKILPRRITGTCARHQRSLCTQIKRARSVAMLPFSDK